MSTSFGIVTFPRQNQRRFFAEFSSLPKERQRMLLEDRLCQGWEIREQQFEIAKFILDIDR